MAHDDLNNLIVPDLLPPSEDGVFKTLLTHPEAQPVLRDVIESYLHIPVVKANVRNVETPISSVNEKRERFDVNCVANDDSQLDVEMQADAMKGDSLKTSHAIVKGRSVYHVSDLHSGQDARGVRYDKLMRSFHLTLCGYTVFPHRKEFIRRFSFRDEGGELLSDAVEIIFVELSKLGDVIKKPVEAMTGEELWSCFFYYAANPKYNELTGKLIAVRKEIKMASELLQSISRDEIQRAHFRSRKMFQMDMDHDRAVVRDEAKMEIARKLLKRNRPIDEIIEDTGLTSKEVESLRNSE
jgi:predicted transposase/invertase (TIGR01784 family)